MCSYVLLGLGSTVLLGWSVRSPVLGMQPGSAPMKANTALGFILGAVALRLLHETSARAARIRRGLAVAGALLGAVTLSEYGFAWDAGIDQLLFADTFSKLATPGRMSPITALGFVLLGAAMMIEPRVPRPGRRPSEWLAVSAGAPAMVALLGHMYGVRSLYAVGPFASVALLTALAFLIYTIGMLIARPEMGLARRLASDGPGGELRRRLLPAALVIPVVIGWLRLMGQRAGWYATEFGLALFAASNVLCFSALIMWTARVLERAEAVRRRSDELLRMAFEGGRMVAWEMNVSTGRWRVSDNAREVLGALPTNRFERLEGALALIHPEDRARVERALQETAREGTARDLRFRTRRPDTRQTIWLEWRSVTREVAGAGSSLRGVLIDVTDAVRAEEAMRLSEARYRTQFESAPEAIVTLDVDRGAFIEVNQNAERLFGLDRQELLSSNPVALSPPLQPDGRNSEEAARGYIERALAGEHPVFEWTHRNAAKEDFPCEVRLVRLPGGRNLCRGSVLDISERKRTEAAQRALEEALRKTEDQLRQSQKMEAIGRLAGGVAHDFNNLLSVILGYGSMLLAKLRPEDPMRASLDQMVRASERAAKLTAQLLAFSRQQVLSVRVIDLNQAIRQLADMLDRLIGEDIELSLTLRAASNVCVDPSQIEQVVMNLVVNARDAMPSGGKLAIETADVDLDQAYARRHIDVDAGPYVMLAVSDTGCGMDKATREHLFEPFFTTKGQGKGTGLGLSTVFGIIKQSGGNIWVYSELGKGTTFKVYLPRAERASVPSGVFAAAVKTLRGSETVLLVEDDEQVRSLARTILKEHGYRVLEAAAGAEALLICEQFEGVIDALLTDVVMPRMSGRELAERLGPLRPNMKVLFMSGYTDDAVVRHGVLSSGMAFVQKPLLPEPLLSRLRQVLDSPARNASTS